MRRTAKETLRLERITTALISLLAGFGALTLTALLLSAAAAHFDLSKGAVSGMSGAALAAGCFACSFCITNRRRKNGLLSGILCGSGVFCTVLLLGAFTVKLFSAAGVITKLVIILASSALGGYKGVNTRPVFRR